VGGKQVLGQERRYQSCRQPKKDWGERKETLRGKLTTGNVFSEGSRGEGEVQNMDSFGGDVHY